MKKQLITLLVLFIAIVPFWSSMTNLNNVHSKKTMLPKASMYYLGDTNYGNIGAYAVYGSSPTVPCTVVEVYQYSTGTYFTATGSAYSDKTHSLAANLTASNGYTWDGVLVE